jgi:hypothetical protein
VRAPVGRGDKDRVPGSGAHTGTGGDDGTRGVICALHGRGELGGEGRPVGAGVEGGGNQSALRGKRFFERFLEKSLSVR